MSQQPFFSHSWHRVAGVRPRLKAHARIHPQRFRGETWYVLQDPQSGRFHRLSAAANLALCLMDGGRTVAAIWDLVGAKLGPQQPTQDEMIRLLGQLHAADLLASNLPADIDELVRRGDHQARRELMGRLRNPIAFRISLLDPDRLLAATLPLVAPLFSVGGFLLWQAAVAGGAVLAALHWDGLTADVADHALAPSNIVLMLLVYPVVKGLHELGHGWAAERWGGEVHEIGIMLLVFFPVPYVDASDAAGFAGKWQRAVVGAGMMVELLIAAVAVAIWVAVEPGLVRAVAFSIMLIAGVSTLVFNGNPLLRYDGYYVLGDLIEIPNLGPRSNQYLACLAKRWLLGVKDARSPVTARGEPFWLVLYGVAAFAYRLAITLVIALYLSTKAFLLGVLLAIVAIGTAVVLPMLRGLRYLLASPDLRQTRGRAVAVVALLALVVAGSAFAAPAPYATIVEGVVWMPEDGLVRAGTGGAVGRVIATPGGTVQPGDPLLELEDPLLDARIASLAAQQREVQLQLEAARVSDMVSAEMYRQQLAHVGAALDQERRRKADLVVRAGAAGRFVLPMAQDLPGHIVERGAILGYVVNSERPMVRAPLASQDDIDLILRRAGQVEARFAQRPERSYAAVRQRMIPGTVDSLPSPILGAEGGGQWVEIPTGPDGRRRLVQEAFLLDFLVEGEVPGGTIGSRVHLRIDHGPEAVGWRVLRSLRQLFLRQLDV